MAVEYCPVVFGRGARKTKIKKEKKNERKMKLSPESSLRSSWALQTVCAGTTAQTNMTMLDSTSWFASRLPTFTNEGTLPRYPWRNSSLSFIQMAGKPGKYRVALDSAKGASRVKRQLCEKEPVALRSCPACGLDWGIWTAELEWVGAAEGDLSGGLCRLVAGTLSIHTH